MYYTRTASILSPATGHSESSHSSEHMHFTFQDTPRTPDARSDYTRFRGTHTPIVIDNGAGVCRAGWGGEEHPRMSFDSLVARPRFKRDDTTASYRIGNDIDYPQLVRWSLR